MGVGEQDPGETALPPSPTLAHEAPFPVPSLGTPVFCSSHQLCWATERGGVIESAWEGQGWGARRRGLE